MTLNAYGSVLMTIKIFNSAAVQVDSEDNVTPRGGLTSGNAFANWESSINYEQSISVVTGADGNYYESKTNNVNIEPVADVVAGGENWKRVFFNEYYSSFEIYPKKFRVRLLTDNNYYISVSNGNLNNAPDIDNGTNWVLDRSVLEWVVGKDYVTDEESYSPINFRRFRSQQDQVGNEPSVDDGTNWLPTDGVVTTPVNVLPADSSTDIIKTPLLTIDAYSVTGSQAEKEWVQYQLSSDAFATVLYDSGITTDFDGHIVETPLPDSTLISQRARSKGVRTDITAFSLETTFTTSANLAASFAMVNSAGTGIARTIVTGVDLTTKSGSVWIKNRNNTGFIKKMDTSRGFLEFDVTRSTAESANAQGLTAYGVNSINIGTDADYNANLDIITHYIIQNKVGFHTTIEYSGTGVARTIAHGLGVQAGFMIVKPKTVSVSPADDFQFSQVYLDSGANAAIRLDGGASLNGFGDLTDVLFTLDSSDFNEIGTDYIAEIFAHNPIGGVFAGKYTGTGATGLKIVTGFPVGWVIIVGNGASSIVDIVSGVSTRIVTGLVGSTEQVGGIASFDIDGFTLESNSLNALSGTYRFLAIKDPTAP